MKKLLAIIMVLALALALTLATGCGNKDGGGANEAGIEAEASMRGSKSGSTPLDRFDVGDATLDDINTLDTEGTFRSGAPTWSKENLKSIADDE